MLRAHLKLLVMDLIVIIGLIALGLSVFLITIAIVLKFGIDTICYRRLLKTRELYFPILLSENMQSEMLSKPLFKKDLMFLAGLRYPTIVEQRIWRVVRPFQIIGAMFLVGGNLHWFDSIFTLLLALLVTFVLPFLVFLISITLIRYIEVIYWSFTTRKYVDIQE